MNSGQWLAEAGTATVAPAPEESELLCGGWGWDPLLRELRHHRRARKGWQDEPEAVERLRPVRSVTWHRWSQAPMQTATGQAMPSRLSRIVAAYEGGGDLTINENDRECAGKLARVIAEAYGLEVVQEGAPGGRRPGTVPSRDAMGRLANRSGRTDVVLDEVAGEIAVSRRGRLFGGSRRSFRATEVRRIELGYDVKGPMETFTVWAMVGVEEERLALASYSGYEGWADPVEWRGFAQEMGRSLGVEARLPEA